MAEMNEFLFGDFDAFDDDIEVPELLEYGVPRKIYDRTDYFNSMDQLKFFQRFRLRKATVLELLPLIEGQLEFPSDKNAAVSPINQLLTALRFYATDGHLSTVADFMGMHIATSSRIIGRVSRALASLYRQFVKMPQTELEIKRTQNDFYNIARFPRVIGAVDGTHIKIQSVGGDDAETFRNRKDYFSVNVQAICNANLEFLDVVARWPGSTHDATIFNNCRQRAKFEDGIYGNSLILGDSGHNIRPFLLTPLLNPMTEEEQLYNESHIRTRNTIERAFGVWKRRFPVLAYGCRLDIDTFLAIIIACAVLHNLARKMGEGDPPLPEEINQQELQQLIENGHVPNIPLQVEFNGNRNRDIGSQVRRNFINNYFGNLQRL